jgi:hypothetical protein
MRTTINVSVYYLAATIIKLNLPPVKISVPSFQFNHKILGIKHLITKVKINSEFDLLITVNKTNGWL